MLSIFFYLILFIPKTSYDELVSISMASYKTQCLTSVNNVGVKCILPIEDTVHWLSSNRVVIVKPSAHSRLLSLRHALLSLV